MQARDHRLELVPTPDGVVAQTLVGLDVKSTVAVDIKKSPKPLAEKWMAAVGPRPEVKPDGE